MLTIPVSFFSRRNTGKLFQIIIDPEGEPSGFKSFTIDILPVRYGKKHAITYEMDDGLDEIYTNVFRLFNGGKPDSDVDVSEGLFYTNGFGSALKFKGNSVGNAYLTNGNSILDNMASTMYINWIQHQEMYNAGWGLMGNHGAYSNYSGMDVQTMQYWEDRMKTAFESRYSRNALFAVLQGGVTNFDSNAWIDYLIDYCGIYLKVMGSASGGFTDQINIENLNLINHLMTNNTVYQTNRYSLDGKTENTLISEIDSFMLKTGNFWFRLFSHRVSDTNYQTQYSVFKNVMKYIESAYGLNGQDNIWFPSVTELIEYMVTKEKSQITIENVDVERYNVNFDFSMVPANIFNKSLTFKINSVYPIVQVITNGYQVNYSGINTNTLLVDLQNSI